MTPAYRIETLTNKHRRDDFSCGVDPLDRYFREQVSQDIRRRYASCFVAIEQATDRIASYYTLAAASIALNDLPEVVRQKLPRYPTVPAVRMGRLAVAKDFANRKLGIALLADAIERTMVSDIAAYALIVDAKDKAVANFYNHHGFSPFGMNPLLLYFPLGKLRNISG
ncbi:MAG: GNAT family N-acetyltransferase [Betaproteobacteria bacterium]|nr:GNAT family N-acetyltransferase [Betaproteobacteria bacterium]